MEAPLSLPNLQGHHTGRLTQNKMLNYFLSQKASMKNHDSFDSRQQASEELQRRAREELGRRLTEQELHTMAEQLMHGTQLSDSLDSFHQPQF
jgi:hypothetical protein